MSATAYVCLTCGTGYDSAGTCPILVWRCTECGCLLPDPHQPCPECGSRQKSGGVCGGPIVPNNPSVVAKYLEE